MNETFLEFISSWTDGGVIMIPICLLAIALYSVAMILLFRMARIRREIPAQDEWGHWVDRPEDARGMVRDIIVHTQQGSSTIEEMQKRFDEVRLAELPPIETRLVMLKNMVVAAPLLGLLGTVFGMVSTFQALSVGSGKIIDMVAAGISEALITTEMGLLVAIPGYFLMNALERRRTLFVGFLAHLESVSLERMRRKEVEG